MKKFLALLSFALWINSLAIAGDVAQQIVTFQVDAINELSINGGSNYLAMAVGEKSTTGYVSWAITTNETNKRIMGSIDADMAPGATLSVELEAPAGSLSKGPVILSTTAKCLVADISKVADKNLGLTYMLFVDGNDGNVEKSQRVLTLTLTDGL